MKYGLLGKKLGHSFSPQIHAFLGDYSYNLFETEPNMLSDFFQNSDFDGINVTSLSEDSFGKIWISTYANGIYCYDSSKGKILRHFSSSQTGNNKIPTDKISSIYVDSKDRVWAVGLTYGFSV